MSRRTPLLVSVALLAMLGGAVLVGCGGSGGGSSNSSTSIAVTPKDSTLKPGAFQIFTATLNGAPQSVTWSIDNAQGGTIDDQGRYRASTVSGTYTVRATLAANGSVAGTTQVTVDSGYIVNLTGPVNVGEGRAATYVATVAGPADMSVSYTASAGSITPAGIFTAPSTAGTVTITATSVADPGKSKTLTVTVAPPLAIVTPVGGTLALARSQLFFSALVDGAVGAVDWTTDAGTITSDGVWTAPDGPTTATIRATRRDDPSVSTTAVVESAVDVDAVLLVEGKGEVVFDLRPDQAPNTCANFASLINKGFYDGIIFHRYEPGFVIQWGDPLTKTLPLDDASIGTGGPGYTIPFEPNPLMNVKYAVAMARGNSLDSGGSQVYIPLEDQPSLDGHYVVFGMVRSGQSVVDTLRRGDKITSMRLIRPPSP